jgi:hypothetical protein
MDSLSRHLSALFFRQAATAVVAVGKETQNYNHGTFIEIIIEFENRLQKLGVCIILVPSEYS